MDSQLLSNQTTDTPSVITDRQAAYEQYGKLAARNMEANASSLESSLDNVYERFLNEQRMDSAGVKSRIKRIREEILQVKSQNEKLTNEIVINKRNGIVIETKIDDLASGKLKLTGDTKADTDYMPYVISIIITVLLTLYLFVFYSSAAYSVFYGIKPGSTVTFINPNVFSDAQEKGGGAIALILLFPVIFLGMGFLINDALDKRSYLMISALLGATFIADFMIGYKISQGLYENKFNLGEVTVNWGFSALFASIDFYFVLVLGFVVYIIWGILLHYVLDKNREMQPDRAMELKKDSFDTKIAAQQAFLDENTMKGNVSKEAFIANENLLMEKQNDITGYENGVIPINTSLFMASVGDFMMGWYAYTNLMFVHDSIQRAQDAKEKQQQWINIKLKTLKTDQ